MFGACFVKITTPNQTTSSLVQKFERVIDLPKVVNRAATTTFDLYNAM
jgi:hypothetical protein